MRKLVIFVLLVLAAGLSSSAFAQENNTDIKGGGVDLDTTVDVCVYFVDAGDYQLPKDLGITNVEKYVKGVCMNMPISNVTRLSDLDYILYVDPAESVRYNDGSIQGSTLKILYNDYLFIATNTPDEEAWVFDKKVHICVEFIDGKIWPLPKDLGITNIENDDDEELCFYIPISNVQKLEDINYVREVDVASKTSIESKVGADITMQYEDYLQTIASDKTENLDESIAYVCVDFVGDKYHPLPEEELGIMRAEEHYYLVTCMGVSFSNLPKLAALDYVSHVGSIESKSIPKLDKSLTMLYKEYLKKIITASDEEAKSLDETVFVCVKFVDGYSSLPEDFGITHAEKHGYSDACFSIPISKLQDLAYLEYVSHVGSIESKSIPKLDKSLTMLYKEYLKKIITASDEEVEKFDELIAFVNVLFVDGKTHPLPEEELGIIRSEKSKDVMFTIIPISSLPKLAELDYVSYIHSSESFYLNDKLLPTTPPSEIQYPSVELSPKINPDFKRLYEKYLFITTNTSDKQAADALDTTMDVCVYFVDAGDHSLPKDLGITNIEKSIKGVCMNMPISNVTRLADLDYILYVDPGESVVYDGSIQDTTLKRLYNDYLFIATNTPDEEEWVFDKKVHICVEFIDRKIWPLPKDLGITNIENDDDEELCFYIPISNLQKLEDINYVREVDVASKTSIESKVGADITMQYEDYLQTIASDKTENLDESIAYVCVDFVGDKYHPLPEEELGIMRAEEHYYLVTCMGVPFSNLPKLAALDYVSHVGSIESKSIPKLEGAVGNLYKAYLLKAILVSAEEAKKFDDIVYVKVHFVYDAFYPLLEEELGIVHSHTTPTYSSDTYASIHVSSLVKLADIYYVKKITLNEGAYLPDDIEVISKLII